MYLVREKAENARIRKLVEIGIARNAIFIVSKDDLEEVRSCIEDMYGGKHPMYSECIISSKKTNAIPGFLIDEDPNVTLARIESSIKDNRKFACHDNFVIMNLRKFTPSYIPNKAKVIAAGMTLPAVD